MALSLDSKVKEIFRSEEGKAVMEKWSPGSSKDPRMKLVGALTYRKLLSYPESAELAKHADEIDADLKACFQIRRKTEYEIKGKESGPSAVVQGPGSCFSVAVLLFFCLSEALSG